MKAFLIYFVCFVGVLAEEGDVKTTTEEYAVGIIRWYEDEDITDSTTESDDETDAPTTMATSSAARLHSGSSQNPKPAVIKSAKPKSKIAPIANKEKDKSKAECSSPGSIFDKNLECPKPMVEEPSLTVPESIVMSSKAFGDDLPIDDLDLETATGVMYYTWRDLKKGREERARFKK